MTEAEVRERIQLLFCKWCPNSDEAGKCMTREEKLGCVASGGFVDELWQAGYRIMPELKVLTPEVRSQIIQRDTTLWCPTKGEFLDEVGEVIAKAQLEADKKAME